LTSNQKLLAVAAGAAVIALLVPPVRSRVRRYLVGEEASLYPRRWVEPHGYRATTRPLRVFQWNILADGLSGMDAKKGGFSECPDRCLAFDYRLRLILAEITRQNPLPDVIAMEEVDRFERIYALLKPLGYTGVFAAKAHSPCARSLDPSLEDGCALFWLESEVRPLDLDKLPIQVLRYSKEQGGVGVANELAVDQTRPWEGDGVANQLALVGTFSLRQDSQPPSQRRMDFRIAVTHLTAAKSAEVEAMRAEQCRQLLDFLNKSDTADARRPTIVAADLNAAPSRGHLAYDSMAYPTMRAALDSAYERVLKAEPEWTTWKTRKGFKAGEVQHTIDYIFVTPEIQVGRVLLPPEEIGEGRLPCARYPSDHIALAAELYLPRISSS